MNYRTSFYTAALLVPLFACAQDGTQSDSTDYITDGVFTTGVEGPVVDANGVLYAVNFAEQGTIGRITAKDEASLLVKLPDNSIGNGLRFNSKGQLLVADYVNHNVLAVDMQSGDVSVFAHEPAMNQPNDIAISASDTVYASDPNWSKSTGQLWMITADGKVQLVEAEMGTTNGVEVSPDEQFLYVNESVQRKVWRYELDGKGKPVNKTLFYQFSDHGLDGMRTDTQGNLYIARYGAGTIAVLSPKGELVREYRLKGRHPTNVAFGGSDGKTLYVTMQQRGAVETLQVEHPGRAFMLREQAKDQPYP
ncbi:SMP-30/gluconolactonase/LRE family protein [Bowmanella yangjiangensis]|uniref:SMP-30/gluconolactonase/LRE family protein n=1 Tax=Bowmanella yangjiangensis TaxID=2811230 RepID=A0ABS3CRJ2_9ALTE|nr:SMP-30/gluconolactonase/LRE family protein [Bowmanella yangjiangensis]MBN7819726.1 SMP-30/gluconolactonase/LRE family protein [Bowmanella yangjiangensis]